VKDDGLFWSILIILGALALSAWICWPRNVPCVRLLSVGGEMVGTPMGCYVDLGADGGE
jgi:hypothetical protein